MFRYNENVLYLNKNSTNYKSSKPLMQRVDNIKKQILRNPNRIVHQHLQG